MDQQTSDRLREQIPRSLIKQINGRDYISGHTAIDRLIQATDNDWSFRITNVISGGGHVAMQGELTIGGSTRTAWGEAKSTNNPSEELFKNAETDTLKRCARLFGVALELYGELVDEASGEITGRQTTTRPSRAHGGKYAQASANAARRDAEKSAAAQIAPRFGHATDKQARFIAQLLEELEWNREDCERFLDANFGVHRISELGSRQDVSTFIERLQAVKAENEPAVV